ncbi:serine hydrolase domain-containing protein [Priestia taiwanensis]|uniref:6-aminohexanoate-dimer hydrolase n=1 Tax=Priestia taiwanensis TaxID=1347902 RepID=A0A917APP4_9BACI|nr:serine hydrolase [Priestia taiwanensis]MBM7362694.1 CubicO group peptidase (beta-lactamase class C family) [Priestia taiwanensis]GGE64300.1 6-aminohexanoate-dimer hydrolase [Priestia taiwanensis]
MNFREVEEFFKTKNVHAFLVHQHGEKKVTYYKAEECTSTPYKINSITKSIMALLIGIAIDKGYIENVHTPIKTWIPHIPKEKEKLTLYHLLTMTTGEKWYEFKKEAIFPKEFANANNWVEHIVDTPMNEDPGIAMNYNSGSSHLLSYILQEATSMTTEVFAMKYLFEPMRIEDVTWQQDAQGVYNGGFGMAMLVEDLLKIGILCLQKGEWDGQQLISKQWIEESTESLFRTYEHVGSYGYQWWILNSHKDDFPYHTYFAMGFGGQFIIVIPQLELVSVIHSYMPKRGLIPLQQFLAYIKNEYSF